MQTPRSALVPNKGIYFLGNIREPFFPEYWKTKIFEHFKGFAAVELVDKSTQTCTMPYPGQKFKTMLIGRYLQER